MNMALSLRFALREMRTGIKGFRIFLACLCLGVAAIAAVGSVTDGVLSALSAKGQSILGADVELRLTHRETSEEEFAYLSAEADRVSKVIRLRSMARAETTNKRTLVEVKGVDGTYPLYGDLQLSDGLPLSSALENKDGHWGIAVDPTLGTRLAIDVGDMLRIGQINVVVRAFIEAEPDKSNEGFLLGPTVLISHAAMAETGLVREGSLIRYHYKVALPEETDITAWREDLDEAFPDGGWRVRDRSNGAPGVRRFTDRMGMFLSLVGLTALGIGGVGVGNAVRGYLDAKTKTIATFKTLGADGGLIFRIYLVQICLMAAVAILLGLGIGALAPIAVVEALKGSLPVTPDVGVYPAALGVAALYGLLITLIFAIWPLAKARDIPAARLFRALVSPESRWPRKRYVVLIALALVVLVALATILAEAPVVAAGFIGGTVFALLFLRGTGWLVSWAARKMPRVRRPGLRIALANLHRPGSATSAVVLSVGLGLTLFATIAGIEANLNREVSETVPDQAPAFFFVDIQREDEAAFRQTIASIEGVGALEMVPSLRGPITQVNGVDVRDVNANPDVSWVLRGDRGLTYASTLPEGNELVDGVWWPEDYRGPPLISLGDEIAEGLGLKVGDTLTLSVLGREITAEIANTRSIDWGTYGFNFVIIFAPGLLEAAPHTYMATVEADGVVEETTYVRVTDAFPGVTAIRMKEVLTSLNDLLMQIGTAIRITALVSILTGILVLAGAMAAGYSARAYDSVVLKVLGATRSNILKAYVLEYVILGGITGLIALGLGSTAAYFVVVGLFESEWVWPPLPMVTVLGFAIVLTVVFGLLTTWRVLSLRPYRLLGGL